MKMLSKIVSRFSFLFSLVGFIAINLLFLYQTYWHELIVDRSKLGAAYSEVQVSELYMDKVYNNLIALKNPFGHITDVLYPFGLDIVGANPGFAFNLIFFRPFFSVHQSLALIIITSLFLANLGMYLLLRKMGFGRMIAFLIGLAYGFMTYLTVRLGQIDYSVVYLFPWFFFSFFSFLKANNIRTKVFSAIGVSFFSSLTLWQNMYYFTVLTVACGFLLTYFCFINPKKILILIKRNIIYLFLSVFSGILINIPWLISLKDTSLFSYMPQTKGWGGANTPYFSSDLLNYFVPSGYNYYYGKFVSSIFENFEFARTIWENFTYPGVIILMLYLLLFVFWRKYPKQLLKKIKPYLYASLLFAILTFGPFLHVAGRWALTLDEGIQVILPLPFIFLHYVPLLGNIRAPGRLVVGFIFFAYIVCAFLLTYFLKKRSDKFKFIFFMLFMTIFIIDHRMMEDKTLTTQKWPNKIFSYVKNDPSKISVLEIPFTVRDGFTYFGYQDAIYSAYGQSFHNKPVLGAYAGRIPNYIKDYYQKNALTGYLGRLTDINWQNNPALIGQDVDKWSKLYRDEANDALSFLDLKYVIQDSKKDNSATISAVLQNLNFKTIVTDGDYLLWQTNPQKKEFLDIDLDQKDSPLLLGFGWYDLEDDFRWADRRTSVMFKINQPRKLKLNFKAEAFYKEQAVTIYLNKKRAAKLNIITALKKYSVPINIEFKKGINTVYFVFDKYYQPSKVIQGSADARRLSAKFNKIWLSN